MCPPTLQWHSGSWYSYRHMELFNTEDLGKRVKKPLADRMRPKSLEQFVGQVHLLGEGKFLKILLGKKEIPSMIFWGPSGVGKTTLGFIMGKYLGLPFVSLSAVNVGIKEVKEIIQKSKLQKMILFIDEFHRFNKLQQDTFLPYVESGEVILIGATTENPSFEIVAPLLSRMKVLTLAPLSEEEVVSILTRALKEDAELRAMPAVLQDNALQEIAALVTGDARKALNLLEVSYALAIEKNGRAPVIDHETIQEAYQKRVLVYDKKGEMHYDLISALHKSLRGSDPDGALYWLARMLEAGEDPLYVARRMTRFASEDVGNADPQALSVCIAAMEAFNFLGPPEGLPGAGPGLRLSCLGGEEQCRLHRLQPRDSGCAEPPRVSRPSPHPQCPHETHEGAWLRTGLPLPPRLRGCPGRAELPPRAPPGEKIL